MAIIYFVQAHNLIVFMHQGHYSRLDDNQGYNSQWGASSWGTDQ
jgi:hypothetical protein